LKKDKTRKIKKNDYKKYKQRFRKKTIIKNNNKKYKKENIKNKRL